MIKAVLFDADGVLIDGQMFSETLARDHGITTKITEPFFSGPFRKSLIGEANLKEILLPYLKKWNWRGGVEAFLQYWFESEHSIDEALVEYIQQLRKRNITCCLATNQTEDRIEYMLKKMGFANNFDKIYASSRLGHRKPSLKFYSHIVDDLGLKKDQILFWDDTEKNVDSARHFGIHAEIYTDFENFKEKMKNSYKL